MSQTYFLTSERLGFRRWTEADLDLALALWGDPRVTRLIDSRARLTEDQVRERLLREISTDETQGIQYWPIFLLGMEADESGRVLQGPHVGCCGLRPYEAAKGVLELGVQLCAAHWDRGYATEAARAVMERAFETLGARALFAGHHPENEASRHLLRKHGFSQTHEELYEPTGLRHPSYLLTAEDYAIREGK